MDEITLQLNEFRSALQRIGASYGIELDNEHLGRVCSYYQLLLAWNSRLHLVAPCAPKEFATRHVLESLLLLPYLSRNATVADIGSGAGLPIIPNLIVRRDIHATVIEASKKKAVFLREALRVSETSGQATVNAERFEQLPTPAVNYVTCRALDRFVEMFPELVRWSPAQSTLLLFGGDRLREEIEGADLEYSAVSVPRSDRRFLFICQKLSDRDAD
jgi:16S rRNA (guanine527-N7)-methyltransferase